MAETVDLYVVNKHGVISDKYYLGGNKTAKFLRQVATFTTTAGEFEVLKAPSVVISRIVRAIEEEVSSYFDNKIGEVVKDLNAGTYNDDDFWFNIVISERR